MDGHKDDARQSNGHSSEKQTSIPPRLFPISEQPSIDDLKFLTTQSSCTHYPLASSMAHGIPIYSLPPYSSLTSSHRSALQDEWYHILLSGPGVFVTKNLYTNKPLLESVNTVYKAIIEQEKEASSNKGDHFAAPGANDRIWNSFSKHCLESSSTFLQYYSNPYLPLIAGAWLGPHHRLTAQVNIVRPGAKPQISHRDYHLGFQSAEDCAQFPRALQVASQFLTLQGAVAHSDMPLDSGPTRLLPFSQMLENGYMAYRLKIFQDYFLENYVSVALDLGDGLFFNPALFHAAGQNDTSHTSRSANLLQISSAFGKPMETIDTYPLIEACWEELSAKYKKEGLSDEVKTAVGNLAEGYPFPTNLDRRVPEIAGMAPKSEQELVISGLGEGLRKNEMLAKVWNIRKDART